MTSENNRRSMKEKVDDDVDNEGGGKIKRGYDASHFLIIPIGHSTVACLNYK